MADILAVHPPAMLLACARCHRQYDVGSYPDGSRVRCKCGNLNTVARPRARQVEMLHCSNCGGRLASSKAACEYCSSEIKLADRGLGPACPECFATTFAGARHCSACGVRLQPEAILRALSSHTCPRCKQALSECESERARYVECTGCGGLWLDEELFRRIASETDDDRASVFVRGTGQPAAPPARGEPVRYLACPVCAQIMHRRNFASCSGVVLDWCRGHGWWFDALELERVLTFIEQGGLEKARLAEHERRKQELRASETALREARDRGLPLPHGPGMDPDWGMFGGLVELLVGKLLT